jgi:hypothetical protein
LPRNLREWAWLFRAIKRSHTNQKKALRSQIQWGQAVAALVELHDFLSRAWVNLIERPSGPLALRFILQPVMLGVLAVRDGVRDARQGMPPYLWSIVVDSGNRMPHLREGLRATSTIIVLAVILDVAYQTTVLEEFYPGEALIVGGTLGLIPYMFIRGLAARFVRLLKPRGNGL